MLGVPFYGYGFGDYRPNWSYQEIEAAYPAAKRTDVIGEACAGCSYITLNSPATIRRKAALAAREAGGVMVWEISQDTKKDSLIRSVRGGLKQGR